MPDNHRVHLSFVQRGLPWVVALVALTLYAATLSHWVTLQSLPYVAKITGWDVTLPFQTPLFYLVTYPFRWLPAAWQPVSLNLFSALCAALTLALLARSVALLPHDRTHEQRQRERSEFSLLSIPAAWIPPVLAAAVCGLELTFWEHSTAASNETLDVLLFAYVIRCLLEFRIGQKESWLTRMSFVYGLGVTNNVAMIGFFPAMLVAVFWIKGLRVFEFRFFLRMLLCGLAGLSLYLLLPLVWALSDNPTVTFGQALRAHLAAQKAVLFYAPQLRTRVLILSLTSILPLLIMAIRWPATFGDTSAAGAALSSVMFRIVHTAFLAACIWVAFDQQFSPRAFSVGLVAFLTFYYLGALSIGYFSGYLLLVFGEGRSKSRHRTSPLQLLINRLVQAAVWVTVCAVPVGLVWKNWVSVRTTNGPMLRNLTELSAQKLPPQGGIVLSDDSYGLLLLSANLSSSGLINKYVMVHTRSLVSPDYHRELNKRYPTRWPYVFTNQPPDEIIGDASLLFLLRSLSRTNEICYLHPSFGYYFELFYQEPHGLVYELKTYPTNSVFPPPLDPGALKENRDFWKQEENPMKVLASRSRVDSRDAIYVSRIYSRALNNWGVELQRNLPPNDQARTLKDEAGNCFRLAVDLNTNNVPAQSNLEVNRALSTGQPRVPETSKSIEEKFGLARGWDRLLVDNGPFDQPEICARLGQIFARQGLFREAAIQWDRVRRLDPTNAVARLALADVFVNSRWSTNALQEIAKLRADHQSDPLPVDFELELTRLEAVALFGINTNNAPRAENLLRDAFLKHPKFPGILDTLLQIYSQTGRSADALQTAEQIIEADPDRVQSYLNEALLYQQQKEPDKALATLDRILQKFQNQPQVLISKIFLLIENKDYARAKTEVDRLLSVEPDNFEALLYKGVVAIETKAYDTAIEPLDRVLKQSPTDPNALRNRAIAYLHLNKLAKAEKDYDALRRLGLRDYVYAAYYGLGEIAFKRQDMQTAERYYNLYLQFAPQQETPELKEEKKMIAERVRGIKEAKR